LGRPERSEGSHHFSIEIATLPATLRSRLRLIAVTFHVRLLRFARKDNFLSAILGCEKTPVMTLENRT
jgi:hypothetical protein